MKFYLGGYFLMKLKPINFGSEIGRLVYSCSDCVNNNLVDMWSYTWTTRNDELAEAAMVNFNITVDELSLIRTWVDKKHIEQKLAWPCIFTDFLSVDEYKRTFFSHLDDVKTLALYFDEPSRDEILDTFKSTSDKIAEIGLRTTLSLNIEDVDKQNEKEIGFDFIRINAAGSFDSVYCYEKDAELESRFNLIVNKYGLCESASLEKFQEASGYLNRIFDGVQSDPWFGVKTKLVTHA